MLSVLKELVLELDRIIQNPNKQTVIVNQWKKGWGSRRSHWESILTDWEGGSTGRWSSSEPADAGRSHTIPRCALAEGGVHRGYMSRAPGHLAGHSKMLGGRRGADRRGCWFQSNRGLNVQWTASTFPLPASVSIVPPLPSWFPTGLRKGAGLWFRLQVLPRSSLGRSPASATGCVTLGKVINPSEPQLPVLWNGYINSTNLREIKEIVHREHFGTAWHEVIVSLVAIML